MNRDTHATAAGFHGDPQEALKKIWSEVLEIAPGRIGSDDNFFALGGESLLITQVAHRVNALFFADQPDGALPITEFFAHTTVSALATRLGRLKSHVAAPPTVIANDRGSGDIAIVGMAGRFPGAADLDTFWSNLCRGEDSIRSFTAEELIAAGVDAALVHQPGYVRRAGLLDGVELFDAAYFGLTAREAAITCPQQRILLECAEEALEHGGYGIRTRGERVGVFIGAGRSAYLASDLDAESPEGIAVLVANSSPATRISFLLDLTGPSFTLDTACSSSLVAVHQACVALLHGDCDMALAGGASVRHFRPRGYRYQEGGILSPDGYCRPFDQSARGTLFTSGAGLVLLKRAEAAHDDRDTIYALLKGTAINNDGRSKAAYTAPSAAAQAAVVRSAQAKARVAPSSIQYVETHGTATPLGDPIEVAALKEAFGAASARDACCLLGAVKANVGHLEAAAGIAGLIKTALMLTRRQIPPTVHFQSPNAAIDFAQTPFRVNTALRDWVSEGEPRRAGVSSFGVGGTNAHVILEEGPAVTAGTTRRRAQLLLLSGKTNNALRSACGNLAIHLERPECAELADIAYTLQVGRAAHGYRFALVCSTAAEARKILQRRALEQSTLAPLAPRPRRVVFMFPEGDAQRTLRVNGLYDEEPVFHASVDRCIEQVSPELRNDLRSALCHPYFESTPATPDCQHRQPALAESTLFIAEYSLAQVWQSWGVRPAFVIGQGTGEYVAACLSGVLALGDALKLTEARGRDRVAGSTAGFARVAHSIQCGEPQIPYVSSVSGRVVLGGEAASADYWLRQLARSMELTASLASVLEGVPKVLLEIGPGAALQNGAGGEHVIVTTANPIEPHASGAVSLLEALGRLWQAGVQPDWSAFNSESSCRRVPLPAYPFERQRHWVEPVSRATESPVQWPAQTRPADAEACASDVAPRSRAERALAEMWQELLGIDAVGMQDDFFALGGDSLLAVQLSARIQARFRRALSLKQLMQSPSIEQLAQVLAQTA